MKDNDCYESEQLTTAEALDEMLKLPAMPETVATVETSLIILAERVDQLIGWCESLRRDNQELREQTIALQTERDGLREKSEQLRARIDAMIVRLKDLGQTS